MDHVAQFQRITNRGFAGKNLWKFGMTATTKVKTTFPLTAFPPRIALHTFSTMTFYLTTFVPTNNEHIAQFQLISKRGFAGKNLWKFGMSA